MTSGALAVLAVAWVALLRVRRSARSARTPSGRAPSVPRSEPDGASSSDPEARARRVRQFIGPVVLSVVLTAMVGPVLGALVLGIAPVRRWRRRVGAERSRQLELVDEVPEVVDLLGLALGAGLSTSEAVGVVGRWCRGPVGRALDDAHRTVGRGAPVAAALEIARDRCGPTAAGLFAALIAADRYGTPLAASLDRIGNEARLDRRRAAEERARRVPVRLLFPLVVCVLPAFGLLTVVPLLVNSLGSLS